MNSLNGIGQKLREKRLLLGISVREMARRADLSPSFVSQVELGRTVPSVGTLYAMVSELGMSLDEVMSPATDAPPSAATTPVSSRQVTRKIEFAPTTVDSSSPVQRGHERAELNIGGATWGRLTNGHDNHNDFLHVRYTPGSESCPADNLIHHPGFEYGYVLTGKLALQVGFSKYELEPGDSISFDSMTPHRLFNPYSKDSVSIWLVVGKGVNSLL